jgi:hypothetical protein
MASKVIIPETLPTSPLSLTCPFCEAKPGKNCATSSGGFAVVHLERIKAAAKKAATKKAAAKAPANKKLIVSA